ncbi:MAG: VOC family protein [Actinomycetota bacterium]
MLLDHVNVVVASLERSLAFYGALGLVPVMDRVLDGPWFERLTAIPGARARCVILDAPTGGCRVELLQFGTTGGGDAPLPSPPDHLGLRHLALRVDDLDFALAAVAPLLDRPPTVVEVPRDIVRSGKRMCYLHDPDGVLVELCAYGAANPEFC